MAELRKYGVQETIYFPLLDPDTGQLISGAACAPGDCKISLAGAGFANTINDFDEITSTGIYALTLTAAELTTTKAIIKISDQTETKVWLDQTIIVDTYGHASAQHAFDLDTSLETMIKAITGITYGGSWTLAKLLKILAAWMAGLVRDKAGVPGTVQYLDPDNETTVVFEVTYSETTPQRTVTVLI